MPDRCMAITVRMHQCRRNVWACSTYYCYQHWVMEQFVLAELMGERVEAALLAEGGSDEHT